MCSDSCVGRHDKMILCQIQSARRLDKYQILIYVLRLDISLTISSLVHISLIFFDTFHLTGCYTTSVAQSAGAVEYTDSTSAEG